MKLLLRPELFRWAVMVALAGLLAWTVTAADFPTNGVSSSTNAPGGIAESLVSDAIAAHSKFVHENASILTFGLDSVTVLQGPLLGRPIWQYLATCLYVVLAFVVTRIVDSFFLFELRRWFARTTTPWDDTLLRLGGRPLKIIVFFGIIQVGLDLFDWPDWIENWISRGSYLIIGFSLMLFAIRLVDAGVTVWRTRLPAGGDKAFNEQLILLVAKLLKAAAMVVGVFTLMGHLGFDIRAALASVSVAGLALGLAAQDTVANLFGAFAVFIDRPFKIGERVRVGDVDGVVEEMGVRSTRIRSIDGFLITVPNKTVGNTTITNLSSRPSIRTELNLGLTYDTSARRVEDAVRMVEEIFQSHPKTREVTVSFNRFLDSALNISVVFVCGTTDWKEYCGILQSLNLKVKARFDSEGLAFAFPTQTTIHQFPTSGPGKLPIPG